MLFRSQQYLTLLQNDLGMNAARHANAMAALLRNTLEDMITAGEAPGLRFTHPTDANAVFAALPAAASAQLREKYHFYDWDESIGEVRWMTAFDTPESAVREFADAVGVALRASV